MKKIILLVLVLGVIFRLFISYNGNFIFNMDNGRDMVDVREMVVLKNIRLIGQTTAIDGFHYGPGWYYLSAIPFILSGGDPYATILMEIALWALGGYFLLILALRYGLSSFIAVSSLWIFSNFILLGTQYAFNPNPILFLTPVFIYLLLRYLETGKLLFSVLIWLLAGAFLHFEIAVGIFMPIVIILSLLIYKKLSFLKLKSFYVGLIFYLTTFIPQIIFELTHNFFLTKSLLAYRSGSHGHIGGTILDRAQSVWRSFYDTFLPTLMNFELFTNLILVIFSTLFLIALKKKEVIKDKVLLISALLVFIPLIGLIPLKVDLMRWHLNATLVAGILLVGWTIGSLSTLKLGKIAAYLLTFILILYSLQNGLSYVQAAAKGETGNSHLRIELATIDYIYKSAQGKNFKVYTYMPSVYDWPYQYLIWWHGLKKYGYLPEEYAYAPNKPPYVPGKERLGGGSSPESSGLVFLIKEPDQSGIRHLWENQFKNLELITTVQIGSVTIETRKDLSEEDSVI